jgi:hypothetical protein
VSGRVGLSYITYHLNDSPILWIVSQIPAYDEFLSARRDSRRTWDLRVLSTALFWLSVSSKANPRNGIIASGISNAVLVTFEGLVILLLALLSGSGFSIDNWAALRRKTVLARDYRERP